MIHCARLSPLRTYACSAVSILVALTAAESAWADNTPRFEPITAFSRSPDHPARGGLVYKSDGVYGTASEGGNSNCGSIFRVNGSNLTHLFHFGGSYNNQGDGPSGTLLTDGNSTLWGVTTRGGVNNAGTVYRFNTSNNSLTTLVQFGNFEAGDPGYIGRNPTSGLARDGNGMLWGISGGSPAVIFRLNPGGGQATPVTVVSALEGSHLGNKPRGELAFDDVDSLWGVTEDGGDYGEGLVYKINQNSGQVTVVQMLKSTGVNACKNPVGGLLNNGAGYMLGLSAPLNQSSAGNVYQFKTSDGTFSVAATLPATSAFTSVKESLVNMQNGFFAGMAPPSNPYSSSMGCLFIWNPAVPNQPTLFPFPYQLRFVQGVNPVSLICTDNGRLSGATMEGGVFDKGVVFNFFNNGFSPGPAMLGAPNDPENTGGSQPSGGLTEGEGGRLWGLTRAGGKGTETYGAGTAYSFKPTDDQVITHFGLSTVDGNGRHPVGELVRTPDLQNQAGHFLWGQAAGSYADHEPHVLFSIMDGTKYSPNSAYYDKLAPLPAQPNAGLTRSSTTGRLWSAGNNCLYSINPTSYNQVTTEFTFTGTGGQVQGSLPSSRLYLDSQGVLWGTTEKGAALDFGTIYTVREYHGPTFTHVVKFTGIGGAAPGRQPNGPLAPGINGFLWGTTVAGGAADQGTVFKLDPANGKLVTIVNFNDSLELIEGANPKAGLTPDGRGFLWGTTSVGGHFGYGTVFRIDLTTELLETMFEFSGAVMAPPDQFIPGSNPTSPLLLHRDGNLYGTTPSLSIMPTGPVKSGGNVFRIRMGRPMQMRVDGKFIVDGVPLAEQNVQPWREVADTEDSQTRTFELTNDSSAPITGLTALVSGLHAGDFTVTSTVPDSLSPGQSVPVEVRFDPVEIGQRNAVLTIGGSSPDTDAFVLPLSATAIQRTVRFADAGYSVQEDSGTPVGLTVTLSAPLSTAVKVPFTVSPGTASAADFTISASPVTIPAGATSGTIWVTPKKDYLVEGNEDLIVLLGTPTNIKVHLADDSNVLHTEVVINNDDELPSFREGGGGIFALGDFFGVASNLDNATGMPFTGTWRRNGKVIPGATQPVYRQPAALAGHAGSYQYTIKTTTGITIAGDPFDVWVVDQLPHALTAVPGKTAALAIIAEGPGLNFRWVKVVDDAEQPVNNEGRITGATTNTLKIALTTAADAGKYRCYPRIGSNEFASIDFDLFVPSAVPDAVIPEFPAGQVARAYEYLLPRMGGGTAAPSRIAVSGLPLGLTCHPVTGLISGRPAQQGRFKITIVMSNGEGKDSVSAYLDVAKLPDFVTGNYAATAFGGSTPIGSRLELTVAASGSVTGYLITGTERRRFASQIVLAEGVERADTLINILGSNSSTTAFVQCLLSFTPDHRMTGDLHRYSAFVSESVSVVGWKNIWHATTTPASHLFPYHTFAVQAGSNILGHGSLTVGLNGSTVVAGRLADGSSFATTSFLHPENYFMVYQSLYSNRGGVACFVEIAPHSGPDAASDVFSPFVHGLWVIPSLPANTRYTKNPLFNNTTHSIGLVGGSYQKPAASSCLLGLSDVPAGTSNAQFLFSISSVIVPTPPNVTFRLDTSHRATLPAAGSASNPGRVGKVSFNAGTGAFSGNFTLDYGTSKARTATFTGMLIPSVNLGMGYFTIASPADALVVPAVTVKNSPIEAGNVLMEAYTAPTAP